MQYISKILFICLDFFFVPLENFSLIRTRHHCQWRTANFDLCLALMSWPLRSEGSLTCHTYCDTGHSFIMVISEEPWHSHILPSVWQWNVTTCFYYLGLSRLGFEHPTFRKRGKRSSPLHHRRGYLLYNTYTYCKINVKLMSLFYPYMYI